MSKKEKKSRYSKEDFGNVVKQIFIENPLSHIKLKYIYAVLDVNQNSDKYSIKDVITTLLADGFIVEQGSGSYSLNSAVIESREATVVQLSRGVIFIKVEGIDEDIVVEYENSHNALVGDKVRVIISPERSRKGRIEGVISEIVERSDKKYVGVLSLTKHFGFVEVDSSKMPYDILIPKEGLMGANNNDKVMVEISEWALGSKNPIGNIVQVFGESGDNNAEMHAILSEFDLPYKFDKSIEKAAEDINEKMNKGEIAARRDFRNITTFTIDPADAKDFDDALSIQKLPNGNWEVGVHIADVTHYVVEDSVLDKEALERATSVYLVDRVVPMLPEKLSNFLCSLRPNEDKFCFSAVFEIDDTAKIIDQWFGRTVINSNFRFSYEDAQKVIETGEGEMKEEILTLDRLAKILRKARYDNGSIAFERDEPKFSLDEKGRPIGVYFKEMKDSNHLIEEFMLLANRSVAEFIGKRRGAKKTFVYRIHDKPNSDKFKQFSDFIAKFGFLMHAKTDRAIGKEINKLLNSIKGKKEENLFSTLALRTMAKARYSTENIGHYGLAFEYYTHFTSPIRRYPDMMVHRLLQYYLNGGKNANKEFYEEMCDHSSEREIRASEAERASIKYKMVEFLCDKIGEEFIGFITGVTEWGIYVELQETKIEGMISVRNMKDDFYQFDPESYRMVGMKHHRILTLGDSVKIKVLRADLKQKQLDYELVGTIDFHTGKEDRFPDNSYLKSRTKYKKRR
ncbi:MAG: ribonuclease R [Rikenellaceae bacterium]